MAYATHSSKSNPTPRLMPSSVPATSYDLSFLSAPIYGSTCRSPVAFLTTLSLYLSHRILQAFPGTAPPMLDREAGK